jgi:hypothetical protein
MVEGHVAKAVEVQVLSSAQPTEKNPQILLGILVLVVQTSQVFAKHPCGVKTCEVCI